MAKKVLKGWAFDKGVHAGLRIMATPFFRYRTQAEETAERFAYEVPPNVVRATLIIEVPPKKKATP